MTTELVRELDETIRLLEARLPANPESENNTRLARGLERDMADYFRALEAGVDWEALEQVYYKHVKGG